MPGSIAFVLGAARETRGPFALAARASLRVGLLGGILLGPAAAIGVGARLPGLISGVRDALVIAVYLGAAVLPRRHRRLVRDQRAERIAAARPSLPPEGGPTRATGTARSRAIGASLPRRRTHAPLGSLAYLTLWWRNANAGFGWSAPVWTAFALLVAVAISLLLGHAQRITTLAALAAAAGPPRSLPPVNTRSWRVMLGRRRAGLRRRRRAARRHDAGRERAGPSARAAHGGVARDRVKVIAIDGFDPSTWSTSVTCGTPLGGDGLPLQARTRGHGRSGARVDDDRDRRASRRCTASTESRRRRVAGVRGIARRRGGSAARPVLQRRDRSAAPDASVDRQPRRAQVEDDLGSRGRRRACAPRS